MHKLTVYAGKNYQTTNRLFFVKLCNTPEALKEACFNEEDKKHT
ncbi:MAG: hypothetical protein U5L09_20240 [Bacteroidales bacterium]|nr:hypothetical protein [Bacteroidales bacterium]